MILTALKKDGYERRSVLPKANYFEHASSTVETKFGLFNILVLRQLYVCVPINKKHTPYNIISSWKKNVKTRIIMSSVIISATTKTLQNKFGVGW